MRRKPRLISTDQKCYTPATQLREYLFTKLQIEKERQHIRNAGKSEGDEFQDRVRANDANKVRTLDEIIFPSMANLTFFLYFISSHVELHSLYEKNLKDLLGITRNNPKPENYAFMLDLLLRSILNIDGIGNDEKRNNNFRVALIHKIQQIISIHFQQIITEYSPEFWPLMDSDMNRILGYTSLISKDVFNTDNQPSEEPARTFTIDTSEDEDINEF